jgi:hypothetical protein
VWKESNQPDDEDKHVINAVIDNQDRLRTRIYGANRRGEELVGNIPTGAGSCWVTVSLPFSFKPQHGRVPHVWIDSSQAT